MLAVMAIYLGSLSKFPWRGNLGLLTREGHSGLARTLTYISSGSFLIFLFVILCQTQRVCIHTVSYMHEVDQ